MSLEGKLGVGGAGDLLSALWQQGRTAIVDLVAGGVDRKVVLDEGDPVYIVSSEQSEKLPLRLITHGLVPREVLLAASKAGPDLRQELARTGALSPEAHDRALASLVEEVLVRAFALTEGRYVITDKAEINLPGMLASNSMGPILWKAARGAPPEFAARFLGDLKQRVVRSPSDAALAEIRDLTPQEAYLLSRVDGYSSVHDLESIAPLPAQDVHRLLVGLVALGVLDVAGRPGVKLPRPPKLSPGKGKKKAAAPVKPAAASGAIPVVAGAIPGLSRPAEPETPKEGIDAARELFAQVKDKDHYVTLGVKPASDESEIRKAYYALARNFHPDRFGRELEGPDRELIEALFSRIGEAFGVLSDEEQRKGYDERLKSGALAAEKEENKKPVDKKELARESHEKGRALLASGDRGRALHFLEHAVATDPDGWEYRMALARLLMSDTRTRKRAEPHLLEAMRIDQTKADAYLQLGLLYKMAGVKSRALEILRQGLKWDATHEGIQGEIDELEGKGGDASRFGGLFGKKK
jgi:tetratricopeptide (TPR) repeat protein